MTANNPPLNYEPSLSTTHPVVATSLPPEVSQCLSSARFLHLATVSLSSDGVPTPHVSLMNYTFIPRYNDLGPTIILTTNAQSLKTQNLLANPRVSLLVHDWVSHRPPTTTRLGAQPERSGSPPAAAARSSLAALLLNLNTSALSSISTTIAGEARFVAPGSAEERWCKDAHLANNTFSDQAREEQGLLGAADNASCYMAGDDVRVVLVPVREGRIADWKGGVKDWVVVDDDEDDADGEQQHQNGRGGAAETRGREGQPLTNGI